MEHSADVHTEFWRDALLAGGFAPIPRWTRDPVPGVAAHESAIAGDLVTRLHRLSDELQLPLSSVLLGPAGRDQVAIGQHDLDEHLAPVPLGAPGAPTVARSRTFVQSFWTWVRQRWQGT